MKASPVAFVAARLFVGRRGSRDRRARDQARKALAGAVLSVALSLVPLVTVMQVADGMINGISARYVELGTYHAQAWPYMSSDLKAARDAAASAPGVRGAWIETQSVGVAFAGGRREGAAVRGVEQGFLDDPETRRYLELVAGSLTLERRNDALVGSAMAAKLGVGPGDVISLISLRRGDDGEMLPKVTPLSVRGVVSAGYRDLDAQWILMRQDYAERALPKEATRSIVGVKAGDPFAEPGAARDAIAGVLPPGFAAYSWREAERNLFESLASTRSMLLLIMAVTVAVAAVNVSSALMTLVLERGQEISVMKSLGARPRDLVRIFALGGAALGAAGAVLGCLGGIAASLRINEILALIERFANAARRALASLSGGPPPADRRLLDPAYYLQVIPVSIRPGDIAAVALCTVLLSLAAALGPARRAAALSPLDGFRRR